jgi:hypothetical protein
MKNEISNLVKYGICEEVASIGVYKRYGLESKVKELEESLKEENQCLGEDTLNHMVPFNQILLPTETAEPVAQKLTTKIINGKIVTVMDLK